MASRLEYLIDVLKSEQGLTELEIPEKVEEQEVLYRALQNVRYPAPVTADFLYQQDRYLLDSDSAQSLPVARRYHSSGGRCHCQCGQQ